MFFKRNANKQQKTLERNGNKQQKIVEPDAGKTYAVTLVNEAKGLNTTIEVFGDEYILEAAQAQDIELPYSCCAGVCVVCAGRIAEGDVDQSDHSFLKDKELDAGFVLTCRARPTSDCVLLTHQEDELLEL